MIKRFALLFTLFFALQLAQAQSSYSLNPGNYVSGTVDPSDPNATLFLEITMPNISGATLNLHWDRVVYDVPAGWTVAMCDYQACTPTVGTGRTMEPIPAGGEGLIKLTVQPNQIEGMGTVSFRIYNVDLTSDEDTITFDIASLVGLDEYDLGSTVAYYPNPTSDFLHLSALSGSLGEGTARLYNVCGAEVMSAAVAATPSAMLDLRALPAGVYTLRYENASGVLSRKVIRN